MTRTLKKQLVALALSGALVAALALGAHQLSAQPEVPQSAAQAAQLFERLVAASAPNIPSTGDNNRDLYLERSLISRANQQQLRSGDFITLLRELQIAAARPAFQVTAQKTEGERTVVEIAPATQAPPLPVVVVRENGGFRVDLLATYAKRLSLPEADLPTQIYQRTGGQVVLQGLPFIDSPGVQNQICQSNLKQIGLGILQCSQDYDEKFPRAENWQENVNPYLQKPQLFNCPVAGKGGYALNRNLAGQELGYQELGYVPPVSERRVRGVQNADLTIAVYETTRLTPSAVGTGGDLAFRHASLAGPQTAASLFANFLYADGHVKAQFRDPQRPRFPDFSLNPPRATAR